MKKTAVRAGRAAAARYQEGVMLLEALVAILIFSLGIIAVMGMQAVSIQQVSQSKFRTDASYLANQIIGQMWTDQPNLSAYTSPGGPRAAWDAAVASTLPQGQATIVLNGRQATVTIQWRMPDDLTWRNYVSVANINPS